MSKVYQAQSFNQGAFIDIFPLVECPLGKNLVIRENVFPHIMKCSNYMKRGCESRLTEEQFARYMQYQTDEPMMDVLYIQKEFNNPNYRGRGYYTHASLFFSYDEQHIWEEQLWRESKLCAFESVDIPIPDGWDEILTEYYGDYMRMPPLDKRASNHDDMIIDMERPYTDYII
jgi:lipopolysaccharide cholinephosphotransferase